ncbi:MAG: CBS domain-containing protein [Candidatus Woesearchaeota archaeon]
MADIPDLSHLKALRQSLGLSQQDLARRAGVSQSLVAKIESGRLDPSLSNAQRIADALAAESPDEVTLAKVMSRKVVSFPPGTKALEAVKAMRKRGISQFPVMDGEKVVGRVTETCLLRHVESLDTATVKDLMLPPPPLLDKHTPVSAAVPLLQVYNAVLVLDGGTVVGIVAKADVMGAALRQKL